LIDDLLFGIFSDCLKVKFKKNNLSIDSGNSGLGSKGDPFGDGWSAHNKGLQRGWKFVENAAKLGQLAGKNTGSCTLILGSIKLVSASGAQARVLARCEKSMYDYLKIGK